MSSQAWPVIAGLVGLVACGGETGFSGPPSDGDGDGDDLRPGLTVEAEVGEEHADLAETLGWTAGVPEAEARTHRMGTDFAWDTRTTDGAGVARFPEAIPGTYRVAGYRPLTEAERAALGGEVWALADGWWVEVFESTERRLSLRPTSPSSVVFSEIYGVPPFVSETNYDFNYFFELYNNSDESLLDVAWTDDDNALAEQQFETCYPQVHRSFDRLGGGFVKGGEDLEFSAQRLVIGSEGGREVLQDTDVSGVDLIRVRYTPGTLPP